MLQSFYIFLLQWAPLSVRRLVGRFSQSFGMSWFPKRAEVSLPCSTRSTIFSCWLCCYMVKECVTVSSFSLLYLTLSILIIPSPFCPANILLQFKGRPQKVMSRQSSQTEKHFSRRSIRREAPQKNIGLGCRFYIYIYILSTLYTKKWKNVCLVENSLPLKWMPGLYRKGFVCNEILS